MARIKTACPASYCPSRSCLFHPLKQKEMKKLLKKCLPLLLMLCSLGILAQPTNTLLTLTQGGMFDHVFDRFGNECPLINLSLTAARPGSNTTFSAAAVPTNTCSAGYFDLYFAPGSYFDLTPAAASILCEVFQNISGFINSPLSLSTNTMNRINIYCSDNPVGTPTNALGSASGFYINPNMPNNPNGGIADNQIQKALISGQDPFSNLPMNVFPGVTNFYSGYVNVGSVIPWHLNMASTSVGSGSADLYTVMLHEVVHALGFATLISSSGNSVFGASNNYFSRYDKFLQNS